MSLLEVRDDRTVSQQLEAYVKVTVRTVGHYIEFQWLHLQLYLWSNTDSRFDFTSYSQ